MASVDGTKNLENNMSQVEHVNCLVNAQSKFIDHIFPLYDQIFTSVKFSNIFNTIFDCIISLQVLLIGFWVYSTPYERCTGIYRSVTDWMILLTAFQDPLDYENPHLTNSYICLTVSIVCLLWLTCMIMYNQSFFMIPKPFLYASVVLLDLLAPCFIVPSAYTFTHGIGGLHFTGNQIFLTEIVIGLISFFISMFFFSIGILLKSRSVIFTNLTFQSYDSTIVLLWFSVTAGCALFSGIFILYSGWYYLILILTHLIVSAVVCYRMCFIPFYTLWKNPICFQFGVVTILLDINMLILYIFPKISYNHTIVMFFVASAVAFPLGNIFFAYIVKTTKRHLTFNDDITDKSEYFDDLGICRNSLWAMRYIVVGLAQLCDYFVDGSMTEYIINNINDNEGILSLALQIVTYFPSDASKLNILYRRLVKRRKLSFINRFLIYQIAKIKTRRLVSNSKDTLEIHNRLHTLNEEVKAAIRSFWDRQNSGHTYIENLSYKASKLNNYFKYTLESNPNNVRITNEYANFLVECVCDYDAAILQTLRADAILEGTDFNVDVSFRSMIERFPRYLTDEYFDTKGKRIISDNTGNSGIGTYASQQDIADSLLNPSRDPLNNSQNNQGSQVSLTSFSKKGSRTLYENFSRPEEIDMESEDVIGRRLIRDSRMRIALNHAIAHSKPLHSNYIAIFAVLSFIIHIFFLSFVFFDSKTRLSWRRNSHVDLQYVGYSMFYNNYATFYLLMDWNNQTGRYNESLDSHENETIGSSSKIIPTNMSYAEEIFYTMNLSRYNLHKVLNAAADISGEFNVYNIFSSLILTNSTIQECRDGKPELYVNASLSDQLSFNSFAQNWIAGDFANNSYSENLFKDDNFCEIIVNSNTMSDESNKVMESILNFILDRSKQYDKTFLYWLIFGLIFIFVVTFIPINATIISYKLMIDEFSKVLTGLPNKVKEDAKTPLVDEALDSSEGHGVQKDVTHIKLITTIFFTYLIIFVFIGAYLAIPLISLRLTKDSTKLVKWFYYSISRITTATEIANLAIQAIILNESLANDAVSRNDLLSRIDLLSERLEDFNSVLMNGNNETEKSLGYSQAIDKLQIGIPCQLDHDPDSLHDMYVCASLNSQIAVFENLINDLVNNPSSFGGSLSTEDSFNMLHLLEYHLYPGIIKTTNQIADTIISNHDFSTIECLIFLSVGYLTAIIIFAMSFIYKHLMEENYKLVLVLIQHLHPQDITNNLEVLGFLHKSKRKDKTEEMPVCKSIVYGASEVIIITNQNSVVEIINPAVTENLGLKPDQMLGQQITNFVAVNDQTKIKTQIDLLITNQGAQHWQDHIELINDLGKPVPFAVTMIGMKDNENDTEINSIVFILTNETEEIKKRTAAEVAKQKSEKLLYQILPKDIVVRLNRGEKDISFTIPKATIFFIDIVKFSNYASSLTPPEIMANLSLVFATFDKIVSKYDTITKIKLIGDVYMAAAGLFSSSNVEGQENTPNLHAIQSVRCCLEVQKIMEDINTKLDAGLEVRIGINTGGPLIGGVLGTDKPTFDIIGDPINIASRLQSTDIPGRVQISQDTKECISDQEFIIEERGEVYLKGKGNRTTYFVRYPSRENESFSMNLFSGKLD